MIDLSKYRKLKNSVVNLEDNLFAEKGTVCEILGIDDDDRTVLRPVNNKELIIHCFEDRLDPVTKDDIMVENL